MILHRFGGTSIWKFIFQEDPIPITGKKMSATLLSFLPSMVSNILCGKIIGFTMLSWPRIVYVIREGSAWITRFSTILYMKYQNFPQHLNISQESHYQITLSNSPGEWGIALNFYTVYFKQRFLIMISGFWFKGVPNMHIVEVKYLPHVVGSWVLCYNKLVWTRGMLLEPWNPYPFSTQKHLLARSVKQYSLD